MDALPPAVEAPKSSADPSYGYRFEDDSIGPAQVFRKPTATIQISPWLGIGGGWRSLDGSTEALASLSAGADATIAIATLFQPPGGDNGGKIRVRLGPWGAVETPFDRIRGEGGVSLAFRQEDFEAWGTLGLRAGAGGDNFGVAHWVGVVSWGLYGETVDSFCDRPLKPSTFGVTNGIRLFISFRREIRADVNEWTFGVEIQPEWFLPLSKGRGYQRWLRH
jgi:hypothetical protein